MTQVVAARHACLHPSRPRCGRRRHRAAVTGAAAGEVHMDSAAPPRVSPQLVALAHRLADAAGDITRKYFRTAMSVDVKSDASPVTVADRAAESAMRALVAGECPEHAVFGEEGGLTRGRGGAEEYVWVLDPIDGTKSFITGKPLFGTLVALVHVASGVPVLGLVDQPVLRERWLGVRGQGTTFNGAPCATRACGEVGDAYLYSTTPHMFDAATRPPYDALAQRVRIPMFGCDCYAYGLLSLGLCDLVAEADLKPYDYMALVPVVEGAGGVITDWQGRPLRWRLSDPLDRRGEVLAAGDAVAHSAALRILADGAVRA